MSAGQQRSRILFALAVLVVVAGEFAVVGYAFAGNWRAALAIGIPSFIIAWAMLAGWMFTRNTKKAPPHP
jgi:hypothetical protein